MVDKKRVLMTPWGQQEETVDVLQCEDAKKVRDNLIQFAEMLEASRKTNYYHMASESSSGMAIMLAEVSARPDAPKTYREWRNWLLEDYKCEN